MQFIICINRFLGRCPDCTVDFDPAHHPNNFDCPFFRPFFFRQFMVVLPEEEEGNKS